MKILFVFLGFASALPVLAQEKPADTSVAEKRAIIALGDAWAERFAAHDPKGLANLFTEDCVRLPNEGKTTIGRQALADAYAKEFAPSWKNNAKTVIRTEEVVLAGNYAFGRGADTTTEVVNGKETSETGKWVAVYRRESNGEWRFHWSTYNSNHPPKSADH